MSRPTILYQGLLASPASWAYVGRGLLTALIELGADVKAISARGFRFDPSFRLPEGLQVVSVRDAHCAATPDVGLGFFHPPNLDRMLGHKKFNLFSWEADRVPPEWINPMREGADFILVPSKFTRQSLVDSGLETERVVVLAHGFDPRFVDQRRPLEDGHVRFLSVAAPHWRKGVRELCQAYRAAFTCQDNVLLHIKTTYDPVHSRRTFPFEISSWNDLLVESGLLDPLAPRVKLDVETLSDACQMEIYRQAHVYVAPTWGESFGLAILEALAHGVPVIATEWSGHVEHFCDGVDWLPYDLRPGENVLYADAPGAHVAIPDVPTLAARMRWHYEFRTASKEMGRRGQAAVSHLTWQNAARQCMQIIGNGSFPDLSISL